MKLTPDRIDKARFTRVQLEWLAWTLRQYMEGAWYETREIIVTKEVAAEFWAGQLAPHVHGFKWDKFVKAVTTGEI